MPKIPTPPPADDALELCEEIFDLIDELPEKAEEFGEEVSIRLYGIRKTIDETDRVTPKQWDAIQTIERGVRNWFHD